MWSKTVMRRHFGRAETLPRRGSKGADVVAWSMNARILCAAAAFAALPAAATAASPFAGTWQGGVTMNGIPCTFRLVITGTAYSQLARCGTAATSQSGPFRVFANHTLTLGVTDWSPRRRYVADTGYTGHYETNAQPPGGTYAYAFGNANTMTWRDVHYGGVITFHRVQ
jgi:hypothetical protein